MIRWIHLHRLHCWHPTYAQLDHPTAAVLNIRCSPPVLHLYLHASSTSSCFTIRARLPAILSLSSSWTVQVNLIMYFALESIYKHLHNCVIGTYSPSASYMASLVCFITFHLCAFILTLNIAPSKHIAEMFQIMYEMCQGLEIGLSKYSLVVTWCCHVMTRWRYYIYF